MSDDQVSEDRPDDFLAFSRFKEEIETQAQVKADVVTAAGKKDAAVITEAGKKEADKYKSELLGKARSEASQIKVREVSRKSLTAKMDYLEVRDTVFDEILLEARSKLQKYAKSKGYTDFLKRVLLESSNSINGGELTLHLRKEDKTLLPKEILDAVAKDVSKTTGNDTKFTLAKNDLKTFGGIRVERADGKLFVDNTFEARLVRMEDKVREELVNILDA